MKDVIFVGVLIAFFALAALYVTWCDRIVGPDEFTPDIPTDAIVLPQLADDRETRREVTV